MFPERPPPVIAGCAWTRTEAPRRILAIRLQALGDVVITLPYLQALRTVLPNAEIDCLTRREDGDIPSSLVLFRRVYQLGGGRRGWRQILCALGALPRLLLRRYDVVLDLQNNPVSRLVVAALRPPAWSAFDRVSPISAGERTRRTIEVAGFPLPRVDAGIALKHPTRGLDILRAAGWTPEKALIILSPAGAFPSRNWPLESYIAFAHLWQKRHDAQFAVLGLPAMRAKATALKARLGDVLLDLVAKTTPLEALAVVQQAQLVLTEDCGLMHMAWTSGVPTLALFGSSRHDWSAPLGTHSRCLHSGDLPCGACMDVECRFGDVHCLTRYAPERILQEAEDLLDSIRHSAPVIAGWAGRTC